MSLSFPVSVDNLARFVAHLFEQDYAGSTITSYVSAISFVHKLLSVEDPCNSFLIKKMLQGCRKLTVTKDSRLPITPDILQKILAASEKTLSHLFARTRFKAMCTLAFCAFLRIGEMTASPNNLMFSGFRVNEGSLTLQFTSYKHSKGVASTHTLKSQPSSEYCPVRHMQQYIHLRGVKSGPLFLTESGEPVPRTVFASDLKAALDFSGLQGERYTSHSFRIGAASFMACKGASDFQIRQAGRWSSNAFLTYIRIN